MFIGFSVSTCGYSLKILFIENFKQHHPPFVNLYPLSFITSKLSRCCSIMSLISLSLMFLTVLNQAHKPVISCIILTSLLNVCLVAFSEAVDTSSYKTVNLPA